MMGISDISKLIKTFENINFDKLISDTERACDAAEETVILLRDIKELLEANLLASKSNYRPTGGSRDVTID